MQVIFQLANFHQLHYTITTSKCKHFFEKFFCHFKKDFFMKKQEPLYRKQLVLRFGYFSFTGTFATKIASGVNAQHSTINTVGAKEK